MDRRQVGATGLQITEISFGTAPIAGLYRECTEESAQETLALAWDSGIRFFDTAPWYGTGLAEERLGRFLASKPRQDFAISTKVGRLLRPVAREDAPFYGFVNANPCVVEYDYTGDGIRRSVEASMKRTGLDRFDILFVHDIGAYTHGAEQNAVYMEQFRSSGIAALNALRDSGVIKGWGLGVNEVEVCMELLQETPMDCILLAGRYTLLDRSAERGLLDLCKARGTSLVIGGVFNSGILATGPVPGAHFDYAEASDDIKDRVAQMQKAAAEAGTDLATAALKFPLENSQVASVLLGSANTRTLGRNLNSVKQPVPASVYDACEAFTIR
ncbi:aldo/keto reductase [Rhizobium sp. LjRoot30]|uniref:aldo/keto reductase n=1 Tax=Rhizobium sp. LjRoot30 TaxID=3342320 RepID=UPI003ECF2E8B